MPFQKDGLASWIYLLATFLMCFTINGVLDSSGVFIAVFVDYFKETNAKAGWVTSLVFFLLFLLSPLVVYIYHRLGFRWCMVISSFFYILAFLITPFMSSLNFLFLSYSIPFGISASFLCTLTITTLRKYFDKYYGFAVGVRYSSNALGAVAFTFVLPIIFQAIGVQKTFLSLLSLTPVFLCYALTDRSVVGGTDVNASRRKDTFLNNNLYQEFLKDKSFVIYLISSWVYFFTAIIPTVFMIQYGVTLGYPLSQAKWLLMIRNITALPARLIGGRVADIALKHGKVKLMVEITYFLFGLLSFLCSFVRSFPLLLLYMGLNGVVEGIFWITFPLLVVEVTGGYHADEAFGFVGLVVAFPLLVGPPAIGWIFDKTGDFRYVFYVIFATSSLASFLLFVSSRVTVEKSLSLKEKAKDATVLENCDATVEISQSKLLGSSLVYETAI